ncbi:hypothetical protein RSOLAG1IB_10998 [Rhizoctonia solani AG-1 IB]|uniref:Uncharacterized protein n=1 Tax=Thanatephorus cucumeris (strain AG1-IB / isolate 7/3/14) TaxID=1108050 RepID=A0A0B7G229_THACB|nr:hypothetical protein RSOLAG1IB_10998 [Rhizoctonia solani AG-1 IB]
MSNQSPQGNTAQTNSIIIADKNYAIAKLQGQDDYQVWRIHMTDMFEDVEVWDIVSGTSTRDSANDTTAWDKRNRAALGALRRRVDTGPMIHVARATSVKDAWDTLQNQYQSLGVAAMTMLRNKFTSLRMNEGDDLETYIKNLRKIFNDLNIALFAESADQLKEIDFVRQLLVSLPDSWQILVSVIPQRPEANDKDGTKLSKDIQSRLLAEYHRRQDRNIDSAFFARNRNVPGNSRGRSTNNPTARLEIICHNCKIPGHKRPECRKPGGGAYKGDNRRTNTSRGRGNGRRSTNDRNNNNRQSDRQNNPNHNEERVNYASPKEFAYSFRLFNYAAQFSSRELISAPVDHPPTYEESPTCVQRYFSDHFQHFSFSIQSLAQYGIALDDAWIIDSGASCHVTN